MYTYIPTAKQKSNATLGKQGHGPSFRLVMPVMNHLLLGFSCPARTGPKRPSSASTSSASQSYLSKPTI